MFRLSPGLSKARKPPNGGRNCLNRSERKRIPCVNLKLESILAGQYAENEFRKQFTASERAAISKAIERTQLKKQQGKKLPQNIAEVSGKETRSLIAERAGLGNPETMRQAQRVVKRGASELVAAMDQGKVSISAAAAARP